MNRDKTYGYIAIILAMLLWSFSFIWSKLAFETYNPFTVLVFRLSIAAVSLIILSISIGKLQRINKEDYKVILLLSLFEPFLYFIGESIGLQYVSASTASIIISTIPLFMPIIGFIFFKELLKRNNIIGVLISFIGVLLVVVNKDFSITGELIGFAFLFLAVFSALGYTVIIKKVTYKYNTFTIVSWQNIIASLAFLPFFLYFDYQKFMDVGVFNSNFIYIILLAIMASNGAFLLYTYAFKHFRVSQIGLFTNLIPIFTLFVSFYVFDEQLDTLKYLGIGFVILGLFISERKRKNIK